MPAGGANRGATRNSADREGVGVGCASLRDPELKPAGESLLKIFIPICFTRLRLTSAIFTLRAPAASPSDLAHDLRTSANIGLDEALASSTSVDGQRCRSATGLFIGVAWILARHRQAQHLADRTGIGADADIGCIDNPA